MYPVTSSQSAPRPDERRRTPRYTVSAIIYVHLGSDNGGIVINLGTGGVAFQAAMRLTAQKDSSLNVRLRGSGLDVHLTGEIVWLGASQKEAGISFKDPSTEKQHEIASWITRQGQPRPSTSYGERPWQELPPAIPFQSGVPDQFGSHSLAAALGMSQTMSSDASSRINPDADPDDSLVSALLDPDSELSGVKPRLEIVPPLREGSSPAQDSTGQLPELDTSSFSSPAPEEPALFLPAAPILEIAPVQPSERDPVEDSVGLAHIGETTETVERELPQSAAETPGETGLSQPEASKSEVIQPVPQALVSRSPQLLSAASVTERWIPPAVLGIWRKGALHHRLLLATAAVACVGCFALVLTLAASHIGSSSSQTATTSQPPQQPAAQPSAPASGASTIGFDPSPSAPIEQLPVATPAQQPSPPPAAPRRAPRPRPQPSQLANFAKRLFGYQPDDSEPITIDDNQLRVQVWTSKTNGYYYCTDDSFYKSVQPGEFMSQSDALQSGYRSILGQFCN